MTIKAKYSGTCRMCGGTIAIGDAIEWEKGQGASHVACPEASPDNADATIELHRGEGYGGRPYTVGAVIRRTKIGDAVTVVSASQRYIRDDGMSFGVGDEQGHIYYAKCRPATDEELAGLVAHETERDAKKNAAARRTEIAQTIIKTGEAPEGDNSPEGERVMDTQNIVGGGDWFVVGPDHVWYVRNNGMDGDDWSANNVRTGGAGAIGWRVPFDAALAEELASIEALTRQS